MDAADSRLWFLLFWRSKSRWWPLRFCHVSALTKESGGWLHVSVERRGPRFEGVPDGFLLGLDQADVVAWRSRPRYPWPYPATCVSVTAALTGAPGALSPDGLFRNVMKNGGLLIDGLPRAGS